MIEIFNQLKAGLDSLKMVENQSKMTPAQAVHCKRCYARQNSKPRSKGRVFCSLLSK